MAVRTPALGASLLWPRPRLLRQLGDSWRPPPALALPASLDAAEPALAALREACARRGLGVLQAGAGAPDALRLDIELGAAELEARLRSAGGGALPEHATRQGYVLRLAPGRASILHGAPAGLAYALGTLAQLVAFAEGDDGALRLPALELLDYPDFAERGVMLDISRDKVPTRETLLALVDRLAGWKINQLQLYMEHTFAYSGHDVVWREASPLGAAEVRELDAYCAARHVQLVPNQNSLGHMHRWLSHEPYRALAECPEGFDHPWNWTGEPYGLCATDPASITFLEGLYDELLPNFRSRSFNVGLDETLDLGAGRSRAACAARGSGRVYLEFLKAVHQSVARRGRVMQFWGDIIIHHPELLGELPGDAVALEWGYEAEHPFAEHLRAFRAASLSFYVCPGTSSWCSFAGRAHNAVANIASAARAGKEAGASGLLVTDWGDHGHLQPLPVSYLGLLLGAGLAWNGADAANPEALDLPALLDAHAFMDAAGQLGRVAHDLGNAYRQTGSLRPNASVLFWNLIKPERLFSPPGVTRQSLEATLEYVERAGGPLAAARPRDESGATAVRELGWVRDILAFSCRLGIARSQLSDPLALGALPGVERAALARELGELIEQHRALWLARNRPGGLGDSARRLELVLAQLRA